MKTLEQPPLPENWVDLILVNATPLSSLAVALDMQAILPSINNYWVSVRYQVLYWRYSSDLGRICSLPL